jgi:hypothetical protein
MSHASLGDIHLGGVYSITTLALPTFFGNLSISGSIRSDGTMRKVKRVIAASQMKLQIIIGNKTPLKSKYPLSMTKIR